MMDNAPASSAVPNSPVVTNPARIEHYYDQVHKASWVRRVGGLFAGATLGVISGAVLGLAAAFLPMGLAALGVAGAVGGMPALGVIATTVATYAGIGAFMGITVGTAVGESAGAVAGGLALQENRDAVSQNLPSPEQAAKLPTEIPQPPPPGAKYFSARPAAFFATLCGGFGAMVAASSNPLAMSASAMLFGAVTGPAGIAASAIMFGLFGSLFGFKFARFSNQLSNFYTKILTDDKSHVKPTAQEAGITAKGPAVQAEKEKAHSAPATLEVQAEAAPPRVFATQPKSLTPEPKSITPEAVLAERQRTQQEEAVNRGV